jgi:zinc resistance-associated protein
VRSKIHNHSQRIHHSFQPGWYSGTITTKVLQEQTIQGGKIMKKSLVALTVVAALAITGSAFARGGMGMGQGMGPGNCPQMGQAGAMTPEMKKFIADTLPLREEMHAKHIQLQKEMIKDKPDAAKVAKLQGEVQALHQKMMDARSKAGLPMGKMGKMGKRGGMMGGPGMGPMMNAPAPAK